MGDRAFPYPYGSDLHWFWGWGHRIDSFLGEHIPGTCAWMTFRPCEAADDAMMRFAIKYPTVIADVREALDRTEAAYSTLCENQNEQTEFRLADCMGFLHRRIETASRLIAEREGIEIAPGSSPESAIRSRDRGRGENSAEDKSENSERTADSKTDSRRFSWPKTPDNPRVLQLAKRIDDNPDVDRTEIDIAREFTNHNETDAQSLLRQVRRWRKKLKDAHGADRADS